MSAEPARCRRRQFPRAAAAVKKQLRTDLTWPCKLKTKLNTALAVLVFVSVLSGYVIGSADYSRRLGEPPDPIEPRKPSASRLHVFQRSAVCTDAPVCSKIGSKILSENGTAVDAAIAAMFCTSLHSHQSMGLGGGFFMTVYIKGVGKAYAINAREVAPGAATVDMFDGNNDKSSQGPLAVAVPGELRGMWLAYKNWGKLPWKKLIAPTIEMCKAGYGINKILYQTFMTNPKIKDDPHMRKMYFNSAKGEFYKPGTIVKPPQELCNTFQRIADNGGDELYNGTLAADFIDDLESVGSIITADDLKAYQAKLMDSIAVPLLNGDTLYVPPPPASGVILANILNILSGYHFNKSSISFTEDKILTYHRIIEAFKYAYAARTKLGDMDFLDLKELIRKVTSPEYGTEVRLRINDTMTSNDINTYGAETYNQPDSGTAHVSIIAPNGDAVSVTSSINYYFGASFSTLKTGILMNNVMDDFSSPGITNYFGLKPSSANFIEPYKRPLSSMSPSIIVDSNGNAKLVVGSSGGTKIITAVALVTIRTLWLGQTLKEAIDEARMHHQITPMSVDYEFGIIEDILQGLRAKGHVITRFCDRGSTVCALYRNQTAIYGNADFRKGSEVTGA